MRIPSLSLPLSDYYYQGFLPNGLPTPVDIHRFVGKKVAVVQRQVSKENLQAMRNMHAVGCSIVYDLDDNIWNLPHGNPGKAVFTKHQDGFAMCAQEADIVTVSTMGLKTAAMTAFKFDESKFLVVPNAVDLNLFRRKEIEKDDKVIIGWGGSNTHSEDCREVFRIIPEVLKACPHAEMQVVGAPAKEEKKQTVKILEILQREIEKKKVPYAFRIEDVKTGEVMEAPYNQMRVLKTVRKGRKVFQVPYQLTTDEMVGQVVDRLVLDDGELALHPQYKFRFWAPIREYANRLASWGWDIAIAPLEDFRFNKSKSNIKMLEAAALQIPCLVSSVQPYQEFCALGGEDLKWLLCSNMEEWESKLICLVNEPERRKYLGQKMYNVAVKFFDIAVIKNLWLHAFRTALQ